MGSNPTPSAKSKKKVKLFKNVSKSIQLSYKKLFGDVGMGNAGLMVLAEKYSTNKQKGIIKVNHKHLDHARASLALIKKIENQDVIVRSVGASGILNKTQKRYLN